MSISKNAMIVNLQIRSWLGHRLDKEASRKVTEDAAADSDVARVNKHLVPKPLLAPITTSMNIVRSHFYKHTLPWKDNGDRLLPRKAFTSFMEEHGRLAADYEAAVEHFLKKDYLVARDQASFRMGALFDARDYPPSSHLRTRFSLKLDIDAVTEAGDFRVGLDKQSVNDVRTEMRSAMQTRINTAVQDLWARVSETLTHFHEKMSEEEPTFRVGTIKNLEEVVEILPSLNFLDDEGLDQIIADIKQSLIGYSAKELRENETLRSSAAAEAARIMEDMQGFMNAFSGAKAA